MGIKIYIKTGLGSSPEVIISHKVAIKPSHMSTDFLMAIPCMAKAKGFLPLPRPARISLGVAPIWN